MSLNDISTFSLETLTFHKIISSSDVEFSISKIHESGAYKSTIYLSQGEIIKDSINFSSSYFQISLQINFILIQGIFKLKTLVLAVSVI